MATKPTQDVILAIDQGTTSTRVLGVDPAEGKVLARSSRALEQFYPGDGWVEHDPMDIWRSVLACGRDVVQDVGIERIAGIGITNQRETAIVWDRVTGEPIYRAIVWQDRRTARICETLKARGLEGAIQMRTGLVIDPYFSGTKIAWLLAEVPGARERAAKGELAFGTVDSWLIWRLTGGSRHVTDATNASRTQLFDIQKGVWDLEICDWLGVPESVLPGVSDSAADFGMAAAEHFGRPLPILGVAGDQQAACVGQACFAPGMIKSTYGTGCFMLLNTGPELAVSGARLLGTVGYQLGGERTYALEGAIFMAGAVVDWLRDVGLSSGPGDIGPALAEAKENHGCYLVPGFVGLGAPYWAPDARGAFIGMTRDTGRAELVAAGIDSVCYQSRDLIEAMRADTGQEISEIRVDGGLTVSDAFLQRLADLTGVRVVRAANTETTAIGAAYLAALRAGLVEGLEHIAEVWTSNGVFAPSLPPPERDSRYADWKRAVARVL